MPTTPTLPTLQRILSRPGKVEEFSKWREEGDASGQTPPAEREDWPGWANPQFRMYDMTDGWGWRAIQAGLQRRRGGKWGIEDVDVHELHQRFVALPIGLVLMFNIDWFQGTKRGNHSVGAIYITICNNPRSKRFLAEETILNCVIPGPDEPSLEQLNFVLEPFVNDMRQLYYGVNFHIPDEPEPQPAHGYLYINASDLPASRKTSGLRGHTSKWFMCPLCHQPFHSLIHPDCYDSEKFRLREDWRYIKYAFLSRHANEYDHQEIRERRGVIWSALNILPDWLPSRDSPTDFMHAAYLGETKHVIQDILVGGGMFIKRRRGNKPLDKLECFLADIWWPSTIGRLPNNLATGGAGKADQWRNFTTVLVVALYSSWNVNGEIPDEDAPQFSQSTKAGEAHARVEALLHERRCTHAAYNVNSTPEEFDDIPKVAMDRNYRRHFNVVMEWCAAIRIWSSQSISVEEASRAHDCHARACQTWAQMNCHLTPYFHLLMHLTSSYLLRLGPIYSWWAYPYERNNGLLGRFKHNGHGGGELEATLMRGWTKMTLIHDLILHLEALGPNKTEEDEAAITALKKYLKGDRKTSSTRGTLLTMIATMAADQSDALVQLPRYKKKVNLRTLGLYALVFTHLRSLWEPTTYLIPDTSMAPLGEPFIATNVLSYSHPVQIDYVFHIIHSRKMPDAPALEMTCAIVRPFVVDEDVPEMPWNIRAVDLGLGVWHYGRLGAQIVVDVNAFSGHFALGSVMHCEMRLWVTMSLCHSTQEPDGLENDY
ncbi:hypothetical protein A0H81_06975 [Grifola frondosa]|uniref:Uncharacterized protein n=1 Tax=Grifola frondosa TaxID=5627 RepID=A0A1C7M8M2_GRIFR|nr:hypothetical protein A0H81_06975 [Grifola frondosa]